MKNYFLSPSEIVEIPQDLPDHMKSYLLHWKTSNPESKFQITQYLSSFPYRVKLSAHGNSGSICEVFGTSWESHQNAIVEAFKNIYWEGLLLEEKNGHLFPMKLCSRDLRVSL